MKNRPLVVALLLVGGCRVQSGVADPPSGDSDLAPATPAEHYLAADFKADFVDALCDWFIKCGDSVGTPFADHDNCAGVFDFAFARSINETGSFQDALLYRIDTTLAASCLATVNATACNADPPLFEDLPSCVAVFIGRLNAGECCDRRGGCAPGLLCERAGEAGVCSAVGAAGETCFSQTCAAPAICATVRNGDRSEPQCVVPLGLGAGEPCENSFDCLPAFTCQQLESSAQRKCLLRPNVGDFCFSGDLACAPGLFCTGDPGSTPRCAATPAAEGATCIDSEDCATGLICDTEGVSEAHCLAPGASGEPCAGDREQACVAGLGCLGGSCGVVPVPKAIGDACHPDGPECPDVIGQVQCVDRGAGYVCTAPGRENEPCSSESGTQCDLLRGLFCDESSATCKPLPKVGEACPLLLCQPIFSVACVGEGDAARCAPRRDEGEPCNSDDKESIFGECFLDLICLADDTTGEKTCRSFSESGGVCK